MSAPQKDPLDLNRLRLFVQVTQLGSLTKAALANDSLQSTISRQLAALERECGGRLLDRTGRGVTLSALGEQLMPQIAAFLDHADRLAADIRSRSGMPTGEVRIGLVSSLAQPLANLIFEQVRTRFPGIQLRFSGASSGAIDILLSRGAIDLGLLFRYKAPTPSEQPLGELETFLVGPPGDALTARDSVEFAALEGLPLVLPGTPNGLRAILDQLARHQRVNLNIVLEADSIEILRDLAVRGTSYTILSELAVMREVKLGMVQAAPIVNPGLRRTITLATTSHHPLSLAAREVAKTVREVGEALAAQAIWNPIEATH